MMLMQSITKPMILKMEKAEVILSFHAFWGRSQITSTTANRPMAHTTKGMNLKLPV